ncbi:MAG: hypothetical protein M3R52_00080, partial [Acidobacteriota bacterium]|nr:hypothetical protein [Acidobacteriota bacterium]
GTDHAFLGGEVGRVSPSAKELFALPVKFMRRDFGLADYSRLMRPAYRPKKCKPGSELSRCDHHHNKKEKRILSALLLLSKTS